VAGDTAARAAHGVAAVVYEVISGEAAEAARHARWCELRVRGAPFCSWFRR
jgi:hypothetical protein